MKNVPLNEALSLLDLCPLAMLLEENGRIRAFNQAFTALLGDAAAGLVSGDVPDPLIAPLLAGNDVVSWSLPDGQTCWLAIESVTIRDTGAVIRYYHDITSKLRLREERDALATQLRQQSLRDTRLAGLLSRYGIEVMLTPMVSRCRRYNHPLTVVTMSLVTNPQDARDDALVQVAHLLKDQTRWADLVGCTNDYDFILVLQETTQDAALQLVDKLSEQVAGLSESLNATPHTCFGITQCQKHDDAESLLERADAALMEARNNDSGRSIAV
jgi:diguanylate cyclase (GGDEF)-like protein